jgi:molybdopterin synthase sulfur carrier subunit
MAIQVEVSSTLRNLVGARSVESEGSTVGEVLKNLDSQYPGFKDQISDGNGQLHRFVNIYLNDEDVRYLQALDTPLKEGDVVSILPALAGGALANAETCDRAVRTEL